MSNYWSVIKRLALVLLTVFAFGEPASGAVIASASAVPSTSESSIPDPIEIVVMVDESASLSSADIRLMKEALGSLIRLPELANTASSRTSTRVAIAPFSSGRNLPRIDPLCSLANVAEAMERLERCVSGIRRQNTKGNADTDFAGALAGALGLFDDKSASKVVLLMTDGQYDPDGSESLSQAEEEQLESSLGQLLEERVTLWPLGFGKSDLKSLQDYAGLAYQGDPDCAATPYASRSTAGELAEKIKAIIANSTCRPVVNCRLNPKCKVLVNPLLSQVTVEVFSPAGKPFDENDIGVVRPGGTATCADAKMNSEGTQWLCEEAITGRDGGVWLMNSSAPGLEARVIMYGEVNLSVIDCEVADGEQPNPSVKIERVDGTEVDFDSVPENAPWPNVMVKKTDKEGESLAPNKVLLNKPVIKLLGSDALEGGSELNVAPDKEIPAEDQLLVRVAQSVGCRIRLTTPDTTISTVPPTSVTSAPGVTTVPEPSEDECGSDGDCPRSLWPWALLVLGALAAIAYAVWRSLPMKFPEGTHIGRQNRFVPTVYEELVDISGQRRVYFDVLMSDSGPDVIVYDSKSEARYVLTREDDEFVKIRSLWEQSEEESVDLDAPVLDDETVEPLIVLNDASFNVRDADPSASPGKNERLMLRLIWPEPEYDEE